MASFLSKGTWIVVLITNCSIQYNHGFPLDFLNSIFKSFNCKTYTRYSNNYNDSNPDVVLATLITFEGIIMYSNFPTLLSTMNELEKMPSVHGININHLIYLYPRNDCKNNTFDLFLDLLLNKKLLNGKPFKIVAILTHLNNNELTDLANIVSPFFIPIFALIPGRRFFIQKIQNNYRFYDNVIYTSHVNIPKIDFLFNLTRKFKAKMISLFHDYDDTEEIDIMTSYLQENFLCINTYHMNSGIFDNEEKLNLLIEKDHSDIFVFISQKQSFLLNLIQALSNSTYKKKILVIYNYYYPIRNVIDKIINNITEINFPLYVVNTFTKNNIQESLDFLSNMNDTVYEIRKRVEVFNKQLTYHNTKSKEIRNVNHSFSMRFISPFLHWLEHPNIFSVDVEHIRKTNISINHSLIYRHEKKYNRSEISQWKCDKCKHLSDLEPVCTTKSCPTSYYPVYLSQRCCWKCQLCLPGFVKPHKGQQQCTRCPSETLTNQNQTKCVPFEYKYFKANKLQMIVATILSFLGCIYTVTYLGIFIWFRNTPMVKASNLKLSIFQMLLHLFLSIHINITLLQQERVVCFIHSIMGYYLLKLIMSVYIIKTNQLLTIFQTDVRIDKTVCLTMKEIFFPLIYLAVNIFVAIIVLVAYKRDEYGLRQAENTMEKHIYCKMEAYFYVDLTLVLALSVVCSIQSFLARKLPTNYNETYYIFLAMFTTTILLLLSIPLHASYSKNGQQVFVNSCMIYTANISLITIAYGYKIYIMLFQKHLNTKEAFKKSMLEAIKEKVEKQTSRPST